MLVHFVTDEPNKIPAIRAMLEPRYHIVPRLLGGGDPPIASHGVLMVDADLRKMARVEQIKIVLRRAWLHSGKAVCRPEPRSLPRCASLRARSDRRGFAPKGNRIQTGADRGESRTERRCHCLTRNHEQRDRLCGHVFRPASRQRRYAFRMQNTLPHKSSTASRETGLARGLTRYASIMKERSSIVCW